MDDSETQTSVCSDVSSSKPLFPVCDSSTNRQSLFPVIDESNAVAFSYKFQDGGLDWLENKSYNDKAAASVAELQRAIADHEASITQTHSKLSDSDEADSSSDDNVTKVLPSPSQQEAKYDERSQKHKKDKKKKKKHKHKKHKEKRKNIVQDEQFERPGLSEQFTSNTKKVFLEEMHGLEPEHAFRIDRKRDKDLWTYESLYKGHVPTYRRLGNSALGVRGHLSLAQSRSKSEMTRYHQKRNRSMLKKAGLAVRPKQGDGKIEYIPVEETKEDLDEGGVDPLHVMDDATRLYTQGQGVSQESSTDVDTMLDDEILQKVASFNKTLRENPKNVQMWLKFVKFQDRLFSEHTRDSGKQTAQALLDKKLSILTRALSENPGCLELQLARLEVAEDVLDTDQLCQEWDQLLFVHSANVHLWRRYLLYQQSRLSSFSVSKMTKLYHKCFRVLTGVMEGDVNTSRTNEDLPQAIVDVFQQYCTYLQQVGHTERAVASYQAQLEFNLFSPPSLLTLPTKDRAAMFERFWDSNVPRFGEKGAKGWSVWNEEKTLDQEYGNVAVSTETEEEEILAQDSPTWSKWLTIETLREHHLWLPWRPDVSKDETEEDCEDLDRLVLVDDIMPVLMTLPDRTHPQLILGMLRMLGVNSDYLQQELCVQGSQTRSSETHAEQIHPAENMNPDGPFHQMFFNKLFQLPAATWLGAELDGVDGHWQPSSSLRLLVEEILTQACSLFTGKWQTVFTLLRIPLQCSKYGRVSLKHLSKVKSKELQKFMKNLLKESHNRNNLVVWNAYVWLEHELGRTSEALGICETALTMFSGPDCSDKAGLTLLTLTRCQLLLDFNRELDVDLGRRLCAVDPQVKAKVISGVSMLADNIKFQSSVSSTTSQSTILKTRRKLQNQMAELKHKVLLDSENSDILRFHLLALLNCLAIYDLLVSDLDIALSHFSDLLIALAPNTTSVITALKYQVHKSRLVLIQNHMCRSSVPLSRLRASLDQALQEFPDCPQFMKCLVDIESRSHIVGRLRRYVDKSLSSPNSPVPLIMGVLAEVSRMRCAVADMAEEGMETTGRERWQGSGVMHRVRRLMENGVANPVSQHCPLVWRLYYHFEKEYGDVGWIQGLVYRAIQQCPWSKVMYVDGVRLLGEGRLQEMVDLMTEKEIRVRLPVEELELLVKSEPAPDNIEQESMSDEQE